jgi:hypothetical protein
VTASERDQTTAGGRRPSRRETIRVVYRKQVALLPLVGLIPSFLLATYSLTQPWARGRALILLTISRSPGAALMLAVTLAGMVAASVAVATRARRRGLAAAVHLTTGALMCLVAYVAFSMIRHAGVRFLGVIPIATVRPASGLTFFLVASILVALLGLIELALWHRRRGRSGAHGNRPTERPTAGMS